MEPKMAQNPTRKTLCLVWASAMLVSCAVQGETTNPMSSAAALTAEPLTAQQIDGVTAGLSISTPESAVTTIQPEASLRYWVRSGSAAQRH
jgi:hypothetical protein